MQILFVEQQPCIRALKYAEGIHQYPDITLMFVYRGKTLTELYGHGDELFAAWFPLSGNPVTCLHEIVAQHKFDLIHSHNAPDTLTNLCIDLFGGTIPVVHDIHDMMTTRTTPYEDGFSNNRSPKFVREQERLAIERSDAVIAVSDEIINIARQHYQLPDLTYVFPNYVPRRFVPKHVLRRDDRSKPIRIVYEGFMSNNLGHYDLADIFRLIGQEGLQVHLYPSRDNPQYRALSEENQYIFYHKHRTPEELFQELTKYDFGWAGFNDAMNKQHIDTAMPNKMFEYLACGLPVISFAHKSMQRFLEQHQIGIVIDKIAGLQGILRLPTTADIRTNVMEQRHDFTVESNISQIIKLYHQLC